MRKLWLAVVLVAGLVSPTAAQATGQGGVIAEQGDAIVVAVWLVWLFAFVAFSLGMLRLLGTADDRQARSAVSGDQLTDGSMGRAA